jgi:hypothetical protein
MHLAWKVGGGGVPTCWNHMPLQILRSMSSNKNECVLSRKSAYWTLPRHSVITHGPTIVFDPGPNVDPEFVFKWWTLSNMRILQCSLVYIVYTVWSTPYAKWLIIPQSTAQSGSLTILCSSCRQNWKQRVLFRGCSSCMLYRNRIQLLLMQKRQTHLYEVCLICNHGVACIASNTSYSFCTLHLPWPTYAGDLNVVSIKLQCTAADTSVQFSYQCWYSLSAILAFPSQTSYIKCILAYSTVINKANSVHFYHYFSIRINVSHNRMQYEPHVLMLWRLHHMNTPKKIKTMSLKLCNFNTVVNQTTVCLYFLLQIIFSKKS